MHKRGVSGDALERESSRAYGARMNPLAVLFLLLLLVPLLEIYVLIRVGGVIGAIPTIALVVFTAVLGVMLMRFQGWMTLQRTRLIMAQGGLPGLEMLEGMLLLVAGGLLLLPGFLTDAAGFVLLVPALRRALIRWYLGRFGGGAGPGPFGPPPRVRDVLPGRSRANISATTTEAERRPLAAGRFSA
jgi:UPF0716 protein FxsA